MRNNAAWQTLEHAEAKGIAQRIKEHEAAKGDVFVMQDGKKQYYHVSDPLVLDAISSLSAVAVPWPGDEGAHHVQDVLTHGVTMSPTFRIRNVIRDQVSALAVNDMSYNFVKNIIDGFKYSAKDNPEYAAMQAGGAFMHLAHNAEGGYAEHVKRLIAQGVDKATILDSPNKISAMFKGAYEWWESTGERSESLTRATIYQAAYAKAIEQGMPPERAHFEAAYAARDAMDFGLRGTWPAVRMITQVVPFMNARLQGLYKLGRGGAADPTRFAAVLGGITLATIALGLANYGDKEIENLPDSDHNDNWIFRVGDRVYRIPKPFEVGALATIADRGLRVALDGFQPSDREVFMQRLGQIVGSQLNMNPIPQAAWPAIQLWANKDFFRGAAIESQRDQKLSTSQRIGPNTSADGAAPRQGRGHRVTGADRLPRQLVLRLGGHARHGDGGSRAASGDGPAGEGRAPGRRLLHGRRLRASAPVQPEPLRRAVLQAPAGRAAGDGRPPHAAAGRAGAGRDGVRARAQGHARTGEALHPDADADRQAEPAPAVCADANRRQHVTEDKRRELDKIAQLKLRLSEGAERFRARTLDRQQ
jgi:hypothetical protein